MKKSIFPINSDSDPTVYSFTSDYPGGQETIFFQDGRKVSVARSDEGLFDVLAPSQLRPLYTGMDKAEAAEAVRKYLQGE